MPAQARAVGPATVSVAVANQHRHIQSSRDRNRIFGGAVRLLHELFEKKGIAGEYRLMAIAAVQGSSARKGVHFSHAEEGTGRIKLTIQPGSNDTGWAYWLLPPRGESPTALFERLTETDDLPQRPQAAESTESNVVVLPVPTAEEPAQPKTDSVHDFLEDMERIPLALLELFPMCTSMPLRRDLVEELQAHFGWEESDAQQAVQGLINRGCLKETVLRDEARLQVKSDALCTQLTALGGHKKQAPVASATSSPPKPAQPAPRTRAPEASARPLPAAGAPAPKASAAAQKPEFDRAEALANLARKAQMFAEAQKAITSADPAMTALKERRQRLTTELAQVDADMAALEDGKASAIAVLADPTYSQAAVRMGQIDSLIGP